MARDLADEVVHVGTVGVVPAVRRLAVRHHAVHVRAGSGLGQGPVRRGDGRQPRLEGPHPLALLGLEAARRPPTLWRKVLCKQRGARVSTEGNGNWGGMESQIS